MAISSTLTASKLLKLKPNAVLEVDIGSDDSWEAIESYGREISVSGGAFSSDKWETFTLDISELGEQGEFQITVRYAYTEGSGEPFPDLFAALGSPCDVRWAPKGDTAGNYRFYTSGGNMTSHTVPTGAASDGYVVVEFVIASGTLAREEIPA
jgi:hypothetical protein